MLFQSRYEWLLAQVLFEIAWETGTDDFDKKLKFILKEQNTTFKEHIKSWTKLFTPPNSGYLTYDLKSLRDQADEENGFTTKFRKSEQFGSNSGCVTPHEMVIRRDLNFVLDVIYEEKPAFREPLKSLGYRCLGKERREKRNTREQLSIQQTSGCHG
ncbi:hypothetical protein HYFRA_00004519 [Hymenoscyphus fraxineus]|uniref:Uncharacterized protein n=1 Tax=Hymenoscyphus fraxineus TaxID=746836 RepID=A0A9N9KYV4_9HELO|nr:hypothetical protein HYFRA_00004519 [Hymenoscyphus fraxineus]